MYCINEEAWVDVVEDLRAQTPRRSKRQLVDTLKSAVESDLGQARLLKRRRELSNECGFNLFSQAGNVVLVSHAIHFCMELETTPRAMLFTDVQVRSAVAML